MGTSWLATICWDTRLTPQPAVEIIQSDRPISASGYPSIYLPLPRQMLFLREAHFTSGSAKLGDVRSSVRPYVRKIIEFCRKDLGGRHMLRSLGSLNYEFRGFWKKWNKNLQKQALAFDYGMFRDSFWTPFWTTFVNLFSKLHPWRDAQKLWCFRPANDV